MSDHLRARRGAFGASGTVTKECGPFPPTDVSEHRPGRERTELPAGDGQRVAALRLTSAQLSQRPERSSAASIRVALNAGLSSGSAPSSAPPAPPLTSERGAGRGRGVLGSARVAWDARPAWELAEGNPESVEESRMAQ